MTGSKMLKVVGILMIVFGSIALIVSLVTMAGISVLGALGASTGLLWISAILSLVGTVAEFVAGILGVVNWNKPDKAGVCIAFGVIIAALTVVSFIFSMIAYSESFGFMTIISLFSGLVLPVLYLIGANNNKKQA